MLNNPGASINPRNKPQAMKPPRTMVLASPGVPIQLSARPFQYRALPAVAIPQADVNPTSIEAKRNQVLVALR